MADSDSNIQESNSRYALLDAATEEFKNYLEKNGVTRNIKAVLKMLYQMDERPVDPLQFICTYLTKDIVAQAELEDLKNELAIVKEELVALKQDNNQILIRLNKLNDFSNEVELKHGDLASSVSSLLSLASSDNSEDTVR